MRDINRQNLWIQRLVVGVSLALFVIKVGAWYITGSMAVLTDALESTVNIITGFTGYYGLYIAARPRDLNHPYGHGKIELLSASVEGILILLAGILINIESLKHLIAPRVVESPHSGMALIGGTMLVNFALAWYCIKIGRANHSLSLQATGKHLRSDAFTSLGIVLGLGAIWWTGIQWIDGAVALVFGAIIMLEGYQILRQVIAGITDEADMRLLEAMIQTLENRKRDAWIDIHNLRAIKFGAMLHFDCHLTVPWYYDVRQAHQEIEALERLAKDAFPRAVELFIHLDDCEAPASCLICPVADCPHRQQAFQERLRWTVENIVTNAKHR